jgi:prepilin-type N-terminal cleavage/methylation domain-containing protein
VAHLLIPITYAEINMKTHKAIKGFTLIEMLLVLVIIAAIIMGIATYSQQKMQQMREDRAVLQIQQILNAGLAFYLNNTTWPTSITTDLQGDGTTPGGYLPGPSTKVILSNPWAGNYVIGNTLPGVDPPNALFVVCTTIKAGAATSVTATILANRLPMAYVVNGNVSADCAPSSGLPIPTASACTTGATTGCTLIATVNVPGQNLNNARSVNFAGVYQHGACVAKPTCPNGMDPQLFLAPASVSGMNDNVTTTVYPIHSFTAYYVDVVGGGSTGACTGDTTVAACPAAGSYWRACLQIITTNGIVNYTQTTARAQKMVGFTRCTPPGESTEVTVSGTPWDTVSY